MPDIAPTDLSLMVAFVRDLSLGTGERDHWTQRLQELKSRGFIRQTQQGRSVPTERGQELWNHALRAIAREVLKADGERRGSPVFVVFDCENHPIAFQDSGIAVRFARLQMEARPEAYRSIRSPEDLVETWDPALLSPATVGLLEESDHAPVDPPTEGDGEAA